ncbi:MAG: c-type cytochrome [Vicinamibacterales bacterium]
MTRRVVTLLGALVLAACAASAPRAQAPAAGPSTADGVYTAAQAETGKEVYAEKCATCHEPAKFSGAEFNRAYVGRPLSGINDAMAEMPMDNPGSLTAEDIGALIAYFLSMNKYPAGETALKGDQASLKAIMVSPRPE